MAYEGAHSRNMVVRDGGMGGGLGRRLRQAVNLPLLVTVMMLVCYGVLVVWSVTQGSSEYSVSRQMMGVALGLVLMAIVWRIDYRKLADAVLPLLVIDVIMLLSPHLPFIGHSAGGATSWVVIFDQQFQPGEFAKIVTIVLFAALVAKYDGKLDDRREYVKALAVILVPVLCLLTQPDLGTSIVILAIGAAILFVGGADRKLLLITLIACAAIVALACIADPLLDAAAGHDVFIKEYQWNRILVFLNNDIDPTGVSYNINQAKIAIGSGGLLGKGIGNATQSALGFLPEAPTDFIFCALAEQLGFVGAMVLFTLYGSLFRSSFKIARASDDLFGTLIVAGICGMWIFQILENVGMDCGLMPITGIPLPFMSYGSSFMITNFMVVGLMLSIWSHRGQGENGAGLTARGEKAR